MINILKSIFSKKASISNETSSSIELLKTFGVEVSVVKHNRNRKSEYILGKMKDKHSMYTL
ncbi:hypothetical protein ACV3SO_13755 [Clostridium perfringens]|nr:hypothetical protein [Clostridium perfringens]MDM0964135.1 hypothetical protein [Clostridium perfringens]